MSDPPSWVELASELGVRAVSEGDPTRWYEQLWSAAGRGEVPLPWDHDEPNDVVAAWLEGQDPAGRRAVVVGCGLGADAEHLARLGFATTGFDISASAIRAARDRHPDSAVDYRVADLLELDEDLVQAFDLVVEVFTIQALHGSVRERAVRGVRRLVASGGTLLAVQFVRADGEAVTEDPPWLLDRAEMSALAGDGLALTALDTLPPHGESRFGNPRWRAVLTRP